VTYFKKIGQAFNACCKVIQLTYSSSDIVLRLTLGLPNYRWWSRFVWLNNRHISIPLFLDTLRQ